MSHDTTRSHISLITFKIFAATIAQYQSRDVSYRWWDFWWTSDNFHDRFRQRRYVVSCRNIQLTYRNIGGSRIFLITFDTLRPRQNGSPFLDVIFKCIFLKMYEFRLTISLMYVPKGPINNFAALVQIMAWRRPGDKPLSKPMMVSLLTHRCVTRPQRVKIFAATTAQCQCRDVSYRWWDLWWTSDNFHDWLR